MGILGRGFQIPLSLNWGPANPSLSPSPKTETAVLMAGLGTSSLPSQALSDTPDGGGCYQVGAQSSRSSGPGEWQG